MNRNARRMSIAEKRAKVLFWGLLSSIVVFSFLYIFLVNKTILNVVARERIQNENLALNSNLGDIESRYINKVNAITIDTAYRLGFNTASERTVFIAKDVTKTHDVAFRN